MKTLQELTNEMNLYKIDSIPQTIMNDEYFKRLYNEHYLPRFGNKEVPEDFNNIKSIECGYFVEVREQLTNVDHKHELFYIENDVFVIKHKDFDFICTIRGDWKTKRNELTPYHTYINKKMKGLNYDQIRPFVNSLATPNRFTKANEKNITAWFKYCSDYLMALDLASDSTSTKRRDNEREIENFINSIKEKKVQRNNNWVTVETDNFYVQFELLDNGAYLSKKITYKGGLDGIIKIENK